MNPPAESFTLAPGNTVVFAIRFHALFPGPVEAQFRVVSNDSIQPTREVLLRGVGFVSGAIRNVSKTGAADFTTIQSAINAASAQDTIRILNNSAYDEGVNVGLSVANQHYLTIEAAPGMTPTLVGSNSPNAVLLIYQTLGVRVEGLNIISGIRNV
ncbi:MAG: hypothetical protein GKR87_10800 [Kiritimatiellae bacterium]|nr:hypothetical protein [Kiritimatiellia bacterium]